MSCRAFCWEHGDEQGSLWDLRAAAEALRPCDRTRCCRNRGPNRNGRNTSLRGIIAPGCIRFGGGAAQCTNLERPESGGFPGHSFMHEQADGNISIAQSRSGGHISVFGRCRHSPFLGSVRYPPYCLVRYWSTTDQGWRPLVLSATALTGKTAPSGPSGLSHPLNSRERTGGSTSLKQTAVAPARSSTACECGKTSPAGSSLRQRTSTPVRWLGLTLLKPGSLYSVYFIEERSPGTSGRGYSLTRIAESSWLIGGHEKSYVKPRGRSLSAHHRYPHRS